MGRHPGRSRHGWVHAGGELEHLLTRWWGNVGIMATGADRLEPLAGPGSSSTTAFGAPRRRVARATGLGPGSGRGSLTVLSFTIMPELQTVGAVLDQLQRLHLRQPARLRTRSAWSLALGGGVGVEPQAERGHRIEQDVDLVPTARSGSRSPSAGAPAAIGSGASDPSSPEAFRHAAINAGSSGPRFDPVL